MNKESIYKLYQEEKPGDEGSPASEKTPVFKTVNAEILDMQNFTYEARERFCKNGDFDDFDHIGLNKFIFKNLRNINSYVRGMEASYQEKNIKYEELYGEYDRGLSVMSQEIFGEYQEIAHGIVRGNTATENDLKILKNIMRFYKEYTSKVTLSTSNWHMVFHTLLLLARDKGSEITTSVYTKEEIKNICLELVKNRSCGTEAISLIAILLERNSDDAVKDLLSIINSLKSQEAKKNALSVLFRMELGKINISEEGVKYLEKQFDLGDDNRPDKYAQRLTANGHVGIFNQDRFLEKIFQIKPEDFESGREIIQKSAYELTCQHLFFEKPGETEEEKKKREKYLAEFKNNYYDFLNDDFFKETGIRFNDLNFREQGWFLAYCKKADEDTKKRLIEFAKNQGEVGLKSFLSMEMGGDDGGDRIIKIGEELGRLDAMLFFNKLADLADMVNKENSELLQIAFSKEDISSVNGIQLALIKKMDNIIRDFYNKLSKTRNDEERNEIKARLNWQIENMQAETILTATTWKIYSKEDGAKLEHLKGMEMRQDSVADLIRWCELAVERLAENYLQAYNKGLLKNKSADYHDFISEAIKASGIKDTKKARSKLKHILQMLEMYRKNYEGSVKQKNLLERFTAVLNKDSKNAVLYTVRRADKLVAFMHYEQQEGNNKYAGSLNVDESIADSAIGSALFQASLDIEAKDSRVNAYCDGFSVPYLMYNKKFGFVANEVIVDEKEGTYKFAISREVSPDYAYLNYTDERLIQEYKTKKAKGHIIKIKKDSREDYRKIANMVNVGGYSITRTAYNNDDIYCALEKRADETNQLDLLQAA